MFANANAAGTNTGRLWNGAKATNKHVMFHVHAHSTIDPKTKKVTQLATYLDKADILKQLSPRMEEMEEM